MNLIKNRVPAGLIMSLLCMTMLQGGCMVATALKGKKGTDVSTVKAGSRMAEVEAILGIPVRKWMTSMGIQYRVYVYDADVPPRKDEASLIALGDLFTAGLAELSSDRFLPRISEKMAIAYDANDIVVGVFDRFGDFDMLPPDGRAR